MTTGDRIKEARKQAGLSQKELADKLGISFQTLAQWETGKRNPKYDTLKRIADALGVSVNSFMTDVQLQKPTERSMTAESDLVSAINGLQTLFAMSEAHRINLIDHETYKRFLKKILKMEDE